MDQFIFYDRKMTMKSTLLYTQHFSFYCRISVPKTHLKYAPLVPGNLWEELREDTLVLDPQVTSATLSPTPTLQDPHIQTCVQVLPPVGQTSGVKAVARCKAEYEDDDTQNCLNGLHPVAYPGMENLSGYLTSCTTSISLM